MTPPILRRLALSLLVVVPVLVSAQQTPTAPAAAPDMIDRIGSISLPAAVASWAS